MQQGGHAGRRACSGEDTSRTIVAVSPIRHVARTSFVTSAKAAWSPLAATLTPALQTPAPALAHLPESFCRCKLDLVKDHEPPELAAEPCYASSCLPCALPLAQKNIVGHNGAKGGGMIGCGTGAYWAVGLGHRGGR